MARTNWVAPATTIVVALCAHAAFAQQPEVVETEYRVPKKTLELGVGAGYSQGTGQITGSERVSDVARAGGEAAVDIGWRFNERWFVGGYGSFGYFRDGADMPSRVTTRGVSAGVQGQYHLNPLHRVDPWIGFGAGYRGIYASPQDGPVESRHGIQLARFRVGVDFRASPGVALGPVLGLDTTMFTGVHRAGTSGTSGIDDNQLTVAPFFFAGIGGRFDFNTERIRRETMTTASAF